VLFHLLVMLAEKNVTLTEVMAELDRREGVSGLEEKANRSR
jgi:phosphoribosyl-ATP pyrophosphohydrolase